MHTRSDADIVSRTHNTARYFTENRHVSAVLLIGTLLWGVYGYIEMPKRKDPEFPVIYCGGGGATGRAPAPSASSSW